MKKPRPQTTGNIAALCKRASAMVNSGPAPTICIKPSLTTNALEQAAASYFQKVQPGYLAGYASLEQRQFMFHCIYVPIFCRSVIGWISKQEGAPRYWLWEHGTYLLAFERLLMEMNTRQQLNLKIGLLETLADSLVDYGYWRKRFNQWRNAAQSSYQHFIRKQSPAIKKNGYPHASYLGTIKNLSGGQLPEDLFGGMLARINADLMAAAAFHKSARKIEPARWGEPGVDTWLIEIWPLVTEYGWNYSDICQVANEKWEDAESSPYDTVPKLSDRCKRMLGLKLSVKGQTRQGRPTKVGEFDAPILPTLAGLAVWIRSIGDDEEEWIGGQV